MESFGKSMIFTVFAKAKEEISSSKTCMITISPLKSTIHDNIGNVVTELYSNEPYDRNSKFQCFEKVHLNFLYYSVLENDALQHTTSNGVHDCG